RHGDDGQDPEDRHHHHQLHQREAPMHALPRSMRTLSMRTLSLHISPILSKAKLADAIREDHASPMGGHSFGIGGQRQGHVTRSPRGTPEAFLETIPGTESAGSALASDRAVRRGA